MKLGFSTSNIRGMPGRSRVLALDRFLNFTWPKDGEWETIQFFNQTDPKLAAAMLRQLADKIEGKSQ